MRELENEFTAGSGTTDDYNMGHSQKAMPKGIPGHTFPRAARYRG